MKWRKDTLDFFNSDIFQTERGCPFPMDRKIHSFGSPSSNQMRFPFLLSFGAFVFSPMVRPQKVRTMRESHAKTIQPAIFIGAYQFRKSCPALPSFRENSAVSGFSHSTRSPILVWNHSFTVLKTLGKCETLADILILWYTDHVTEGPPPSRWKSPRPPVDLFWALLSKHSPPSAPLAKAYNRIPSISKTNTWFSTP